MTDPKDMPLLDLAQHEIGSRRGGYGGKENAFEFIARRWNTWFKNNKDLDVCLDGSQVASMMVDFKIGRKEARAAAGVAPKRDDAVDAAAYLQWEEELHRDIQNMLEFVDEEDLSDKAKAYIDQVLNHALGAKITAKVPKDRDEDESPNLAEEPLE